ncbi:MAG: hypothetical protein KGZ71_06370 [Desulfobulbaceae bacterium]|nr:hypothetical protein [Desulfobulbaceae bacterium]
MYKKVCTVLSVFLILCIVSSCKNPAGNCSKFCKYRTNIKDGSNYSNEKGFGEFNKNGSQKICGPFPTGSPWPSFEVHLKVGTTVEKKLCTNNGLPISQEGKTSWFTGDHCVTQDEGKQYKDTP